MNVIDKIELMNGIPPGISTGNKMQVLSNVELVGGDFILHPYLIYHVEKAQRQIWFKVTDVFDSYHVSEKYRKCKPSLRATDFYMSIGVVKASQDEMDICDEIIAEKELIAA